MSKKKLISLINSIIFSIVLILPITVNAQIIHSSSRYGFDGKIERWISDTRSYDWYINQATTGADSDINCVPSCTIMTIKYFKPNSTITVEQLRNIYPYTSGKGWTALLAAKVLLNSGISSEFTWFNNAQEFEDLLISKLEQNQLFLISIDTSKIPQMQENNRLGRFYKGKSNHMILVKGYVKTNKNLYLEIYDPASYNWTYGDNKTPIGINDYYSLHDLYNANMSFNGGYGWVLVTNMS